MKTKGYQKLNTLNAEIKSIRPYKEVLDFALSQENKDVKNIGIIGVYGSGKTTTEIYM